MLLYIVIPQWYKWHLGIDLCGMLLKCSSIFRQKLSQPYGPESYFFFTFLHLPDTPSLMLTGRNNVLYTLSLLNISTRVYSSQTAEYFLAVKDMQIY